MKVTFDSYEALGRNGKANFYNFTIADDAGHIVGSGRGFSEIATRDDAVQVSMRRATGLRPRLPNPTHVKASTRSVIAEIVAQEYGALETSRAEHSL
jgi:hypothetical protein